jgi:hypothetical protein
MKRKANGKTKKRKDKGNAKRLKSRKVTSASWKFALNLPPYNHPKKTLKTNAWFFMQAQLAKCATKAFCF